MLDLIVKNPQPFIFVGVGYAFGCLTAWLYVQVFWLRKQKQKDN